MATDLNNDGLDLLNSKARLLFQINETAFAATQPQSSNADALLRTREPNSPAEPTGPPFFVARHNAGASKPASDMLRDGSDLAGQVQR